MTDKPLPGLPQAPAAAPEPMTPLDTALADLQAAAVEATMHARTEAPNVGPADTVALLVAALVEPLAPLMSANQLRTGLLAAFERAHVEPMSFTDIAKAKTALETLADMRRREIKITEGGIILPPKP